MTANAPERFVEGDEIGPVAIFVMLAAHPVILFIARKLERGSPLRPHESLVVVRRRVDQGPHDLLRRPLALCNRAPGGGIRYRAKLRDGGVDRLQQPGRNRRKWALS